METLQIATLNVKDAVTGSRLGRKRFRLCGILRGSFHHLPLEKGLKLERHTRLQFAVGIPMPSELSTMPAVKSC